MDPDACDFTINYPGGSLRMPLGNLKSLFGPNLESLTPVSTTESVTVATHSRTRVIGQPSTQVAGHTYTYQKWPTSQANNAAAGKIAMLNWTGSGGYWDARVTGSFAKLGTFLANNTSATVDFRSERGTEYGPYNAPQA